MSDLRLSGLRTSADYANCSLLKADRHRQLLVKRQVWVEKQYLNKMRQGSALSATRTLPRFSPPSAPARSSHSWLEFRKFHSERRLSASFQSSKKTGRMTESSPYYRMLHLVPSFKERQKPKLVPLMTARSHHPLFGLIAKVAAHSAVICSVLSQKPQSYETATPYLLWFAIS